MREIAKRGGQTTKAKYGAEHFREVGAMGGRAGKNKRKPRKTPQSQPTAMPAVKSALATLDAILSDLEA